MENIERVICASIHYQDGGKYPHQPKNIDSGLAICGLRHNNCIGIKSATSINRFCKKIEGFLTSNNRFVDREEAYLLALNANQIIKGNTHFENQLDSSDLY